ncbi:MAG: DUF2259 domain-containing protein [Treponema sp.]
MKKWILRAFCAAAAFALYAGDAAVFVDNGFSEDGKYYIFGQYGKTDKKFQGWAEIFTIDVAANDFVSGGVFRTKPSAVTADKSGKEVYEALAAKSYFETRKYNCTPVAPERILYIREHDGSTGAEEIVFKDFISSVSQDRAQYAVKLSPSVSGSGMNASSSFYIELRKRGMNDETLAFQKIGSPDIVRKSVKNYKIDRILCDKSGRKLIFVIAKTMEDKTGTNIRYMVETAVLNSAFFENTALDMERQ